MFILSVQDDSSLPKGDAADQFKPVVPWPHVEGVEVDLNSIRLKHGEFGSILKHSTKKENH